MASIAPVVDLPALACHGKTGDHVVLHQDQGAAGIAAFKRICDEPGSDIHRAETTGIGHRNFQLLRAVFKLAEAQCALRSIGKGHRPNEPLGLLAAKSSKGLLIDDQTAGILGTHGRDLLRSQGGGLKKPEPISAHLRLGGGDEKKEKKQKKQRIPHVLTSYSQNGPAHPPLTNVSIRRQFKGIKKEAHPQRGRPPVHPNCGPVFNNSCLRMSRELREYHRFRPRRYCWCHRCNQQPHNHNPTGQSTGR